MEAEKSSLPKNESWRMFNDISPKYDLLNRILSLGLDINWRKKLKRLLPQHSRLRILDLATGTADVLILLCQNNPSIEEAVGIDLADHMLEIGRRKIKEQSLSQIHLKHGDICQIPFQDEYFDCVTIAFGIRNVEHPKQVLKEILRVLKKRGRTLILEFSLPKDPILKGLHLFYLRYIVPCLGAMISKHRFAYRYLNQTIEEFPYGQTFCKLVRKIGFKSVEVHPLCAGVASIYVAEKN